MSPIASCTAVYLQVETRQLSLTCKWIAKQKACQGTCPVNFTYKDQICSHWNQCSNMQDIAGLVCGIVWLLSLSCDIYTNHLMIVHTEFLDINVLTPVICKLIEKNLQVITTSYNRVNQYTTLLPTLLGLLEVMYGKINTI